MDDANISLAETSIVTADEVVVATGTFAQMASLGVPGELTDANYENVMQLSAAVTGTGERWVARNRTAVSSSPR